MIRALLALALATFSAASWPQEYPARPVKIIVPYGVGGSADVYARFLGAKSRIKSKGFFGMSVSFTV